MGHQPPAISDRLIEQVGRRLAANLRVNYNTIARVYLDLDRDGVISTQRGRGTFVAGVPDEEQIAQQRQEKLQAIVRSAMDEARALVEEAAELCGVPEARYYLCPYHAKARGPRSVAAFARAHDCRKPNPGMLLEALEDFGLSPEEAFYVGDMDSDREAAANAGMDFYPAAAFFGFEERK